MSSFTRWPYIANFSCENLLTVLQLEDRCLKIKEVLNKVYTRCHLSHFQCSHTGKLRTRFSTRLVLNGLYYRKMSWQRQTCCQIENTSTKHIDGKESNLGEQCWRRRRGWLVEDWWYISRKSAAHAERSQWMWSCRLDAHVIATTEFQNKEWVSGHLEVGVLQVHYRITWRLAQRRAWLEDVFPFCILSYSEIYVACFSNKPFTLTFIYSVSILILHQGRKVSYDSSSRRQNPTVFPSPNVSNSFCVELFVQPHYLSDFHFVFMFKLWNLFFIICKNPFHAPQKPNF